MHTKLLYVVAGLLILAGTGWFFFASSRGAAPSSGTFTGSLADLAARGGAWECSIRHASANDETSGRVYVSGARVRGDFESVVPQAGKIQAYMVSDGEWVHAWTSMMKTGVKTRAAMMGGSVGTKTAGAEQDHWGQSYEYNCMPWREDASVFNLPSDVSFTDIQAAAVQDSGVMQGGAPNCSTCDLVPTGVVREQCKAALKCS